MIDPVSALAFSLFENRGVYALLLGSGLSRSAQIPTGWEITLDLIQRAAALEGVANEPNWANWYRTKFGKEPNYSEVLDSLSSTPEERRSILHSYIEPTDDDLKEGRKTPTRAHRAIAGLVQKGFIRTILTTNFDRLLENALRDVGVEPTIIASDDDLKGAIPLIHSRCYVVKLHGDYLDTRIKNTDEELASYSDDMNGMLDRILDEHGLIVCGWSGDWDRAMRTAIARAPNRRFTTFWTARGELSSLAHDLIDKRSARVIRIEGADPFFALLNEKLETLQNIQTPDPRNVTLLVGTTKRYLQRADAHIQLNDLLSNENRRLHQLVSASDFSMQDQITTEEFTRRTQKYEAHTEALARMFGLIGRWGSEEQRKNANDILDDIGTPRQVDGNSLWIDLRRYPALILLYSFGLGALRAGDYKVVWDWLMRPLPNYDGILTAAIGTLPLSGFLSRWGDHWKLRKGLESVKLPLSIHMQHISREWTPDYLLAEREHDLLFGRFEAIGALAYIAASRTKEDLEAIITNGHDGHNYIWTPLGTFIFRRAISAHVWAELTNEVFKSQMLSAGFFSGDHKHLSLAITSLGRLTPQVYWT